MSEYDLSYYEKEASQLALEIERKLIILDIDWHDAGQLRDLAHRVLNKLPEQEGQVDSRRATAWFELNGLIGLMNVLMAESAARDVQLHGNEAWKAVARALWQERGDVERK